MRQKIRTTFLVVCIVSVQLSFPIRLWAWGDRGHEIVGDIAEATIEPATLDFVRGILGVEPFAVAATFPDKVRDDDNRFAHKGIDENGKFDFSGFHLCDIPQGQEIKDESKLGDKNSFSGINNAILMLKDTSGKYSRESKIIAIRFLMHMMGDVHQPLHIGNGLDIGGNACLIRDGSRLENDGNAKIAPDQLPTLNFHSFWDDGIVQYFGKSLAGPEDKQPRFLSDFRKLIRAKYASSFTPEAKTKASGGTLADWMNETLKIRDSGLYPGDVPPISSERAQSRPYCRYKGKDGQMTTIDLKNVPVIDKTYMEHFAGYPNGIAPNQLIKAGLRLAKVLDDIASEVRRQQLNRKDLISDEKQTEILKSVVDGLRNKLK